jgi:hypothetical protein
VLEVTSIAPPLFSKSLAQQEPTERASLTLWDSEAMGSGCSMHKDEIQGMDPVDTRSTKAQHTSHVSFHKAAMIIHEMESDHQG